jgi:hypothetical protein
VLPGRKKSVTRKEKKIRTPDTRFTGNYTRHTSNLPGKRIFHNDKVIAAQGFAAGNRGDLQACIDVSAGRNGMGRRNSVIWASTPAENMLD